MMLRLHIWIFEDSNKTQQKNKSEFLDVSEDTQGRNMKIKSAATTVPLGL